jgi:chemotaxis protein methyltransferase CheR
MKPEDFDLIANVVKHHSGLVLTRDKAYLLESRLPHVARKWNMKGIEDLALAIRTTRDDALLNDITEAMATNETTFFRDRKPFEQFRKALERLVRVRATTKQIRIWSVAASSGQEAYSAAMICAEEAELLKGYKVDILGTDISNEMVARAKSGLYSHFEVQRGLPIKMLVKHFRQSGDKWQLREEIRNMVQFRTGNLMLEFGPIGVFDIIFCRNVLLYFDGPTRAWVLDCLTTVLAPDGMLFLGNAERAQGLSDKIVPLETEPGPYILASA